jgi:hypothetical protein
MILSFNSIQFPCRPRIRLGILSPHWQSSSMSSSTITPNPSQPSNIVLYLPQRIVLQLVVAEFVGQLVELSLRHVSHRQAIVKVQFCTDSAGYLGTDATEEFEGVENPSVVGQVLAQNMRHPECVRRRLDSGFSPLLYCKPYLCDP